MLVIATAIWRQGAGLVLDGISSLREIMRHLLPCFRYEDHGKSFFVVRQYFILMNASFMIFYMVSGVIIC